MREDEAKRWKERKAEWEEMKVKPEFNFDFEYDSSPTAWEHYRKCYPRVIGGQEYDLDLGSVHYFTWYEELENTGIESPGEGFNYADLPDMDSGANRLVVVRSEDERKCCHEFGGTRWYKFPEEHVAWRLGGECDFNFSEKKKDKFEPCLRDGTVEDEAAALKQLERCAKNHHALVNLSLVLVPGGMQGFKGCDGSAPGGPWTYWFDRLDTLVYHLSLFFKDEKRTDERYISPSLPSLNRSGVNAKELQAYLNGFNGIYDYCSQIYFIDRGLVDRLVESGRPGKDGGNPIASGKDVLGYMSLAEEFWKQKNEFWKQNYGYNTEYASPSEGGEGQPEEA